jgi:NAD(P)-dependent dehydrogenase (short-subunit alcohol dehydrogenase family)
MKASKTAIVTGGNRGIGFEICRQLGAKGFATILAARDEEKGQHAAEKLKQQGLAVQFMELDLCQHRSIQQFKATLGDQPIDILVNNAGVLLNGDDILSVTPAAMKVTFDVNFFGPLFLSQALVPNLKKSTDARIINLSSGMGAFDDIGTGYMAYRTSKTALNGLTAVMAKDLAASHIKVVAMCPGWVQTDMGGAGAPRTPAQGADTAVWLATTAEVHTGYFYRDRKQISW